MRKLNRFTAFMGYKFSPVFKKAVYKNMRKKPISPMELKKATELRDIDFGTTKFVAHRGLSGVNPENTAPAFEAAGKHGNFYGIECDTHMATDGVWMVAHDPNLETLFSGEGDIKEHSSEELLKLKMLRGANIGKHLDVKMCTLQEYIDICKKYNCRPIIEIKDPRTDNMQSFYDMLKKNGIEKTCVVISFILEDLQVLNKIDKELEMWYLVDYLTNKNIQQAVDSGCKGMDFSSDFNSPRPDMIKKLLDKGLVAACWTVDDKYHLDAMVNAGVTYITTNSILPE